MERKGSLKPETLAIIPARGGSKGIPRKNIKMFCGKPLIAWTIEAALKSNFIDRAVVSTEDEEIGEVSRSYGIEVIKRPQELAQDETLATPVMEHAVTVLEEQGYKPQIIALLNPTSPLRSSEHIDRGLLSFIWSSRDSSICVSRGVFNIWSFANLTTSAENAKYPVANYDYKNKARRQDSPVKYQEKGAIYLVRRDYLMEHHRFIGDKNTLYQIPTANGLDIDTPLDFIIAERVMNEALANQSEK